MAARACRAPQILDSIEKGTRSGLRSTPDIVRWQTYSICTCVLQEEIGMYQAIRTLLSDEQGQDIAEYAVMLAVILVIVVGTIRLIGSNANTVFSQVASSIQ
jgi:Flp pilus assembly pilin Flp